MPSTSALNFANSATKALSSALLRPIERSFAFCRGVSLFEFGLTFDDPAFVRPAKAEKNNRYATMSGINSGVTLPSMMPAGTTDTPGCCAKTPLQRSPARKQSRPIKLVFKSIGKVDPSFFISTYLESLQDREVLSIDESLFIWSAPLQKSSIPENIRV
jgi:hypothetical protein